MAATINTKYHDLALQGIKDDNENLYICSQQPTTFAEASSTYKLGTKAAPTISNPQAGDVNGRKIVVSAISDGTVNGTGNAQWFALCDDSLSVLQVAQELNTYQDVTSGNPFTLTELDITLPDPSA